MTDITVPVPDDRMAEFYQFFGLWLSGSLDTYLHGSPDMPDASAPSPAARAEWGSAPEDFEDAVALWTKYSPTARAMFSMLMDAPDTPYSGDDIAEAIGIENGAHGIAGVLAWPGRHGAKLGRPLPSYWGVGEDGVGRYWIPEAEAELFRAARRQVEGD